jgi:hypothetical protein
MRLTAIKLTLFSALSLSIFLWGCGDKKTDTSDTKKDNTTQTQQQTQQTTQNTKKTDTLQTKIDTTKTTDTKDSKESNTVILKTSMGDIEIELNENDAPNHVANFQKLVKSGFYKEQLSRVIPAL